MRFSYHKSPVRLWWRRQVFRFRQLSPIWLVLVFICILCLISIGPNPFSAQYSRIPIDQDVYWNNVNELLKVKDQVRPLIFAKNLTYESNRNLKK
jgi:hypothetical protein